MNKIMLTMITVALATALGGCAASADSMKMEKGAMHDAGMMKEKGTMQ
jgi:hypothetical protein